MTVLYLTQSTKGNYGSTIICEVDDEGNLYLISRKIVFPSELEQWDEKWDNDFHIAKISPRTNIVTSSVRIVK